MVEKVIYYKASDGTKFKTKEEAEKHEKIVEWESKLEKDCNYQYGSLQGVESLDDLKDFLSTNPWILDLMDWEVKDKKGKIATEIVVSRADLLTRLTSRIKTYIFNLGLSEEALAEKLNILPVGVQNLNESQRWTIEAVFDVSNRLNLQIGISVMDGSNE